MVIELSLIGIGTGNPDHVTLQAIRAINAADVILLPRKGESKADLADLRRTILKDHLTGPGKVVEFDLPVRDAGSPDYLDGVNDWHDAIAAVWAGLIAEHAPQGGRVALLVWGDPSLYDSTLRIAEQLRVAGLDLRVEVVPGLTSLQLLTAVHAIPLNDLGAPVVITTGRQIRDHGWPAGVDTVAVMLDGGCAFQTLPADGISIWWAAYLGMPFQIKDHGPLAEAGARIIAARAAARAEHGWIMDIYLMRRNHPPSE